MAVNIFNTINSGTPNSVARAIANTVVAGANAIKSAIITKNGAVEDTATWQDMANEILKITGEVNVNPIQGIPSDWHDLAQVVAQNTLSEFPYCYAILLSKGMQSIQLTGSNRYITSDGGFFAGDRMHTFDTSKDDIGTDTFASFIGKVGGMTTDVTIKCDIVGSVGNIKLTGNGTSVNNMIASWNAANPTKTVSLISGDGTQIPLSCFFGLVNGLTTPVKVCQVAGGVFGEITLIANGVKTINVLISEWNAANPTKQIVLESGLGTQVPTSNIILSTQNIQLSGGVIGNVGKSTRWVIFANGIDNIVPTYNFSTTNNNQGVTVNKFLLHVHIHNISLSSLIFTSVLVPKLTFSDETDIQTLTIGNSAFYASTTYGLVGTLKFPACQNIVLGNSAIRGALSLSCIEFSEGTKSITLNVGCLYGNAITSLIFPDGIENILNGSSQSIGSNPYLTSIKIPTPKYNFPNAPIFENSTAITDFKIGTGWNFSLNLGSALNLLTRESILGMFNSLVDKRKDGINPTTVTTSTSSKIVTAVNGNFTKVFHVGEAITIGAGGSRTIESIQDDDNLTLTTNAATTGSGQSYNTNKILTIGATNLAKMTSAELLIATDKGSTLA